MINSLLLNHLYPVISCDIDEFEKKAYCTRFGHSLWSAIGCQRKWLNPSNRRNVYRLNFLRWNDVPRHFFFFFCPRNCDISSVLSIFKHNPGKANNKFIFLSDIEKKATNYCTRFGHSLWSAISCQRERLRKFSSPCPCRKEKKRKKIRLSTRPGFLTKLPKTTLIWIGT